MSKAHRGKGIRDQFKHGRGECPVCKRNNVKILYEQDAGDKKVKICKICRASIKNGTKTLSVPAAAPAKVAEAPAPAKTEAPAAEESAAEDKA